MSGPQVQITNDTPFALDYEVRRENDVTYLTLRASKRITTRGDFRYDEEYSVVPGIIDAYRRGHLAYLALPWHRRLLMRIRGNRERWVNPGPLQPAQPGDTRA